MPPQCELSRIAEPFVAGMGIFDLFNHFQSRVIVRVFIIYIGGFADILTRDRLNQTCLALDRYLQQLPLFF